MSTKLPGDRDRMDLVSRREPAEDLFRAGTQSPLGIRLDLGWVGPTREKMLDMKQRLSDPK